MDPALPLAWSEDKQKDGVFPSVAFKDKMMTNFARLAIAQRQLHRISDSSQSKTNASDVYSLIREQVRNKILTRRYRSWSNGLA